MSWILVEGMSQDELIAALDMTTTGASADEVGDLGTARYPFLSTTMRSGWTGVFCHYALALDLAERGNLPRLSRITDGRHAISCVVLEHAMTSYSSYWKNGAKVWVIKHLSELGRNHLEVVGAPPHQVSALRNNAYSMQSKWQQHNPDDPFPVDYMFDVPIDSARIITEFRHDLCDDDDFQNFVEVIPKPDNLVTEKSEPPEWWQLQNSIEYDGKPYLPNYDDR